MFEHPIPIDCLRALHLICFAAGMGTAIYHDFLTLRSFRSVISLRDIHAMEALHRWVAVAFGGLWLTGLALLYVRTSFDMLLFSPKLWVKIGIMLLMTGNALILSRLVLPILKQHVGRPMSSLPVGQLLTMGVLAAVSMFCWTSGMVLGSSQYLKTAEWSMLAPLAVGWFIAVMSVSLMVVIIMRGQRRPAADIRNAQKARQPTTVNLEG
jgi:hypothetical protein